MGSNLLRNEKTRFARFSGIRGWVSFASCSRTMRSELAINSAAWSDSLKGSTQSPARSAATPRPSALLSIVTQYYCHSREKFAQKFRPSESGEIGRDQNLHQAHSPSPSPHEPWEHRTSNIELPTSNDDTKCNRPNSPILREAAEASLDRLR